MKKLFTLIGFALLVAISFLGIQWKVVNAQGTIPTTLPIPVTSGLIIDAGLGHTCTVTLDGRVLCWGLNTSGQVGDDSNTNRLVPVFVKDLSGVTNLALGSIHSCVLKSDGTVWCWGDNTYGQLGNGTTLNSSVPIQVVGLPDKAVNLTSGQYFSCAILENNDLWCWGQNDKGQLNDGTTTNQSKPVKSAIDAIPNLVSGGQEALVGEASGYVSLWGKTEPLNILGLSDTLAISGNRFKLGGCSVSNGNIVNCWTEDNKPVAVTGADNAIYVGAGLTHSCSMDNTNKVFCWGTNASGEIGDGTNTDRVTAVAVVDLGSVADLAVGAQHNCAIISPTVIKCWGNNVYGQLGNNTTTNSSVPVLVILPSGLGQQ